MQDAGNPRRSLSTSTCSPVPAWFAACLKCGRLEHDFIRVRCTACHAERLVAHSCKRRGFCPSCAARRMTTRIARHLKRPGLLVRDAEGSYLSAGPGDEDGLDAWVGHSITYRIAVGPNERCQAFRL